MSRVATSQSISVFLFSLEKKVQVVTGKSFYRNFCPFPQTRQFLLDLIKERPNALCLVGGEVVWQDRYFTGQDQIMSSLMADHVIIDGIFR